MALRVLVANRDGDFAALTLAELLPHSFGSDTTSGGQ